MNIKKIFLCIMVFVCLGRSIESKAYTPCAIAVIGVGYVGLVTGTCFAQLGHTVICADINQAKIDLLNQAHIPIYEPGLEELVKSNAVAGRLIFTTDVVLAIEQADCIFIAVDTPMAPDGCADLTAVNTVFSLISNHLNSYKVICVKSTVPIGTGQKLRAILQEKGIDNSLYDLVSNPEFLREGSAISDFMHPDRIVIGSYSMRANNYMKNLYMPLIEKEVPFLCTDITSAETIKYASNAFLAVKLGFINEMANLCDHTKADIVDVAYGMGLDSRIGTAFLKPGPGFGGSCFPKDCQALFAMGTTFGIYLYLVSATLQINETQKKKPVQKLLTLLNNDLSNKTIAILGLAFKNNTDDIRYSPAITTIQMLLEEGAHIKAYDPAAMPNMKKLFPTISYENSLYEAVSNSNGIIIMTEWDEFKTMDLELVGQLVKEKNIVDARNILDPALLQHYSFAYSMMGRP